MWHTIILIYWVNWFHCHHMYDKLLLLNFEDTIFLHLYIFINYLMIDTNNWLCISFCLQSNECIKWTFSLNVHRRNDWISYIIITFWCTEMIWFTIVYMWVKINTSPIFILVWNLSPFFPSWRCKQHDYLFYFCKIVPQYNRN